MTTEIIKVDIYKPHKEMLKKAASVIKKGGLVAFPTETVYGLGADYLNKKAVQKLYKVKERPKDKPFTIHISGFEELESLSCEISLFSKHLIERFWPGPLTIILKTGSGEKIGLRMPRNKLALEFISACKTPIVAPSANISGRKSPRSAEDVLKNLDGRIDLLLDGGQTDVGIESTVVDASAFPYRILREGAIKKSQIADVGRKLQHTHV
jgi:L-threonylcarbamoyladenylate synthase